jgi:hypothetical protein
MQGVIDTQAAAHENAILQMRSQAAMQRHANEQLDTALTELRHESDIIRMENERLSRELESLRNPAVNFGDWGFPLNRDDIVSDLIENSEALAADINARLGGSLGTLWREQLLAHPVRVQVRERDVVVYHDLAFPVMFFYTVGGHWVYDCDINPTEADWHYEITWQPAHFGYIWLNGGGWRPMPEPAPALRRLTDLETVTLRFICFETYGAVVNRIEETIPGTRLREETIRLMGEYYGALVKDIWYDGDILYVDLFPATGTFNVGLGSQMLGGFMRDAFEQFPGAREVRFLWGGVRFPRGVGYNGYDLNCLPPCPVFATWGMGVPYDCICEWE